MFCHSRKSTNIVVASSRENSKFSNPGTSCSLPWITVQKNFNLAQHCHPLAQTAATVAIGLPHHHYSLQRRGWDCSRRWALVVGGQLAHRSSQGAHGRFFSKNTRALTISMERAQHRLSTTMLATENACSDGDVAGIGVANKRQASTARRRKQVFCYGWYWWWASL